MKVSDTVQITIAIPVPVSKEYVIKTPQASSSLAIGSVANISWTRPANAMARATIRLQNIPDASKRIGLQQLTIAKAVTADNYAWTVPATIAPGTYKLIVGPEAGNGGPSAVAASTMVRIVKATTGGGTSTPPTSTSTSPVGEPTMSIFPLAQPVLENTHVLSQDNGAQYIPFNGFMAKSEGSTSTIDSVTIRVRAIGSSTLPTTVYLWDRAGTLYASKAVSQNGLITFDNGMIHIAKDKSADILIKADMPSSAISGSEVVIDIMDVTVGRGKISKAYLPFLGQKIKFVNTAGGSGVANYEVLGQPTITRILDRNGYYDSSLTASFPLEVRAVGGNIPLPKSSDFVVVFVSASSTVLSPSMSVVTIPNNPNGVPEASSAAVTVTASVPVSKLKSGFYKAKLINLKTPNGFTDIDTIYTVVNAPVQSGGITTLSASVGVAMRMVFGSIVSLFGF